MVDEGCPNDEVVSLPRGGVADAYFTMVKGGLQVMKDSLLQSKDSYCLEGRWEEAMVCRNVGDLLKRALEVLEKRG